MQWFSDLWASENVKARSWSNKMSALSRMLHGVPAFFSPRPMPPINTTAERPEDVGYYDAAPLKATLERLVDFDLINQKAIQFSIGVAHVRTGAPVTFDNLDQKIAVEHVMASTCATAGICTDQSRWRILLGWRRGFQHTDAMCDRQLTRWQRTGFSSRPLGFEWRSVLLDIPSAYLRATEILQREPPQHFTRPISQDAGI